MKFVVKGEQTKDVEVEFSLRCDEDVIRLMAKRSDDGDPDPWVILTITSKGLYRSSFVRHDLGFAKDKEDRIVVVGE